MASTISLQGTLNWAQPFMGFRPGALGTNNEPAITNANLIKQTILSAPFAWRWNRAVKTFTTTAGQQDYPIAVSDFGYMEKANVTLSGDVKELSIKNCLALDSKQGRPENIAAQLDDNNGNITFRLMKVPDNTYTVTITYQKKATLFSALTDLWSPIPDEFSFIFQRGFLALYLLFTDDPKFQIENAKFVAALLGASEGLDETQKNIFLTNWQVRTGQEIATGPHVSQGTQARGV